MTKELYQDVIDVIRAIIPPSESREEAVARAAPVWERMVRYSLQPSEESVSILLLSSITMLLLFQQGILTELALDMRHLQGKETTTRIRVHLTPGPPV